MSLERLKSKSLIHTLMDIFNKISGLLLDRGQDVSLMCMKPGVPLVLTRTQSDGPVDAVLVVPIDLSYCHWFTPSVTSRNCLSFLATGVQQTNAYSRMLNSLSQLMHCLGEFMHLH
jgi:hypothetical protein